MLPVYRRRFARETARAMRGPFQAIVILLVVALLTWLAAPRSAPAQEPPRPQYPPFPGSWRVYHNDPLALTCVAVYDGHSLVGPSSISCVNDHPSPR